MRSLLICLFLLTTPLVAAAGQPAGPASAAEQEVRAFIAPYNAAYGRNALDRNQGQRPAAYPA